MAVVRKRTGQSQKGSKAGKANVGNMLKAKSGTKNVPNQPGGKKKGTVKKQRPYSQ